MRTGPPSTQPPAGPVLLIPARQSNQEAGANPVQPASAGRQQTPPPVRPATGTIVTLPVPASVVAELERLRKQLKDAETAYAALQRHAGTRIQLAEAERDVLREHVKFLREQAEKLEPALVAKCRDVVKAAEANSRVISDLMQLERSMSAGAVGAAYASGIGAALTSAMSAYVLLMNADGTGGTVRAELVAAYTGYAWEEGIQEELRIRLEAQQQRQQQGQQQQQQQQQPEQAQPGNEGENMQQ